MNVLSLFDGMSCGRIALERAGIEVDKYYASEIDKHAIKVSEYNYPDIFHIGNVENIRYNGKGINVGDYISVMNGHIGLLIGGSPCQGFSFAGKQLNFEDTRSKLFFEFVRILNEIRAYNPDVLFMLENVKMKKEYQDIISDSLGVNPIEINSALVSAQNRKRLYWTNIPVVTQPKDNNILIENILETLPFRIEYGCGRIVGRKINPKTNKRDDYNHELPTIQRFEFNSNVNKTNCLTTVQKDNVLMPLNSQNGHEKRMLTTIECERLQNVPDNYTSPVSTTQAYKMLGNGWTVGVIAHIFKHIATS